MSEKRNIAVLLMAGASTRIRDDIGVKKQFFLVRGKELFLLSLSTFLSSGMFSEIVIVISQEDEEKVNQILRRENIREKVSLVYGGKDRNESVLNALLFLKKEKEDFKVYIHDAARPNVTEEELADLEKMSSDYDALTLACPVYDSLLREVDGKTEYIDRKNVYQVQTPQVFSYQKILEVFLNGYDSSATDDYSKAVYAGLSHSVVKSDRSNYKVTAIEDIKYL